MTEKVKRPRRKRTDTVAAAIENMANVVAGGIVPPDHLHLQDHHRPFWDAIILTRAIASWTPNDLTMAAQLARIQYDIERFDRIMEARTRLAKDRNGETKISPLHRIQNDLLAQSIALARTLQIHARATQGEARDQIYRNTLQRDALQAVPRADGFSLIARPTH